jgi:hypothetical protein
MDGKKRERAKSVPVSDRSPQAVPSCHGRHVLGNSHSVNFDRYSWAAGSSLVTRLFYEATELRRTVWLPEYVERW